MLFTIGHSNHAFEHFLELLRRHGVEAVADVRARPYSRFVPHFSKERLERLLSAEAIGYLYLGAELGGKPRRAGDVDEQQLDLVTGHDRSAPSTRSSSERLSMGCLPLRPEMSWTKSADGSRSLSGSTISWARL